jgi:holo-[acyl-carrier protein] synthase
MIERHGESFLRRIFTEREIRFCQRRLHATRHFAAIWAAKEAAFRCLGSGWRRGLNWTEVEIRIDRKGLPRVVLRGATRDLAERLGIVEVRISMAQCRAYATAQAIAVGSDSKTDEVI